MLFTSTGLIKHSTFCRCLNIKIVSKLCIKRMLACKLSFYFYLSFKFEKEQTTWLSLFYFLSWTLIPFLDNYYFSFCLNSKLILCNSYFDKIQEQYFIMIVSFLKFNLIFSICFFCSYLKLSCCSWFQWTLFDNLSKVNVYLSIAKNILQIYVDLHCAQKKIIRRVYVFPPEIFFL